MYGPAEELHVATATPEYPVSQDTETLKPDCVRTFSLLMEKPVVLAGRVQAGATVVQASKRAISSLIKDQAIK